MAQINVTQPYLPPLDEFVPFLEAIWDSRQLTNCGAFHQQLEMELCEYLGVPYISLFSNATVGLIVALKALEVEGEVITTPYSFVATAQSIVWNNAKPIFVDVDPVTLNLDPSKIEAAITPRTKAIMPVHVYGHPCDVEAIDGIAKRYNLKVVYDAAHAFGVECHCGSILNHGDLSVLSFHATKVFNTFEGGAIVSQDFETKTRIDELKNFGFINELSLSGCGINGKMSEINAAFGILQLKHLKCAVDKRREIAEIYSSRLKDVQGISLLHERCYGRKNYSYFPIFIEPEYPVTRDFLYYEMKDHNINARRYFFPLLSDFSMFNHASFTSSQRFPVARRAAEQVLCLPMYPDLRLEDQDRVVELLCKDRL